MSDFTHYRVLPDHQIPERAGVTQSNDSYLEKLRKNLMIDITKLTDSEIEFDLVGVDVSIANALRRILMAEVGAVYRVHSNCLNFKIHYLFLTYCSVLPSIPGPNHCNRECLHSCQ